MKKPKFNFLKKFFNKEKIRNTPSFKKKKLKFKPKSSLIDFDQIFQNIFSVEERKKIHLNFILVIFLSASYMIGKFAALSLSKSLAIKKSVVLPITPPKLTSSKQHFNQFKNKDLFNAVGVIKKAPKKLKRPKIDLNLICEQSSKKSSLPIKLINTIVLQDTVKSVASVQVRKAKEIMAIREGDELDGIAKVSRIQRLRMIFKNLKNGQCEFVANLDKKADKIFQRKRPKVHSPRQGKKLLQKKNPGIKNVGNSFKIKKSVRDQALANISEVFTQARAVQFKNPDGTLSFKMTEIVPGSIYDQLNIKDGDIISNINGKGIDSVNQIMSLFGKIRDIDHFEITVNRDGINQTMEYDFE